MLTQVDYSQFNGFVRSPSKAKFNLASVLIFLIPALQFVEINIIGRLSASEVALAFVCPLLLSSKGRHVFRQKAAKKFWLLCFLWLVGQVSTDLIVDTPVEDLARGWAKIIMTLIIFPSLYILTAEDSARMLLYLLGHITGGILRFYLHPGIYSQEEPWKFGLGPYITLLAILGSCHLYKSSRLSKYSAPIITVILAGINLLLNARSVAGFCFAVGVILYYINVVNNKRDGRQAVNNRQLVCLIIVLVVSGIILNALYGYAASEGVLGDKAKVKYDQQAMSEYGLIIGGRGEILVSSVAIFDSPIVGHGSWAKDDSYAAYYLEAMRKNGIKTAHIENNLIQTHSHIFGAWVEAGILGLFVWAFVILLAFRSVLMTISNRTRYAPLVLYVSVGLLWDVLFSPYGADMKLITPFGTVVAIHATYCAGLSRL